MMTLRFMPRLACAALVVAAVAAPASAAEARPAGLPPWTRLTFDGHKLVFKAEVTLEIRPPVKAEVALRECPEAPGLPAGTDGMAILDVSAKLGGRKQATLWLDAATGGVLQVEDFKERERQKIRRYGTCSAHSWRARPDKDGEKKLPPEQWTRRRDDHAAWDPALTRGLASTDSYAMIPLACSGALAEPGAQLSAYTVTHEHVVRVTFRNAGTTQAAWDVALSGATGAKPSGTVPVRKILVTAEVLDPDQDDDDDPSGPFGMKGPVQVLVEPSTSLPLEVRGRVPKLGEVKVALREATVGPR